MSSENKMNERKELQLKSAINTFVDSLTNFVGEDSKREGLLGTPTRLFNMYNEIFSGYHEDPRKILEKHFNQPDYDEMVVLKNVDFHSVCEHHFLPFYGTASVAYIPKNKVVGISKLARLVKCFAKRLQIQERMTVQIADVIMDVLNPQGVGVVIQGTHLCMVARGVKTANSVMRTSCLRGFMKDNPAARSEFLELIR